ncbi:UPF0577 protein KIAA1324-like [Dendronephthya gigantea]|uniref:UPF0577 protein KIAA1324-like n=1 Tax=Dendronephthya gigantea TaxID=151771 RepID=UPI00106D7E13|nr:UPF0577 protein KIAA1324-like [Dendronephthya gigantea]
MLTDREVLLTMFLLLSLLAINAASARLPACQEGEYEYEFTECDSAGGRWRVPVPRRADKCEATGLTSVRQRKCASTCDSGEFLDVNSPEQLCKACPAGHYSSGGDVIYSNWTTLPIGFETRSYDDSSNLMSSSKQSNCTNSLWKAMGDNVVSGFDNCMSQLTLAVTLKKDGKVFFTYQSPSSDVFFNVYVRNEQCLMSTGEKSYKYPPRTKEFQWNNATVELKRGHNLIVWQAALFPSKRAAERNEEPVMIKSIRVEGVAYTSECSPCPAGTFTKSVGTTSCTPCPADHYSAEGATECAECDLKTHYSNPGSAKCSERKPCTVNDYIEIHSKCDEKNKFKKMFQWIEPKICLNDVKGSTSLPLSGEEEKCPPCNPGMFMNGTTCDFCPPMTSSDGTSTECTKCAASTEPEYGYDFHWWRSWPPNMDRMCQSSYDRGCASQDGFQLRGTSIDSGYGHADDARVLLFLGTDGFKRSHLYPGLGTVTFEFEMQCAGPCYLSFYQLHSKKSEESGRYEKIKVWEGKQSKQKYSFQATAEHTEGFYWVFRKGKKAKRTFGEYDGVDPEMHFKYRNDKVTVYFIKVTKTIDGGAAGCKKCPVGVKDEGCVECPKGNRIIPDKKNIPKCQPCPKNTYLNVSDPYGRDACIACGDFLTSEKGSTECVSSCKFTSKEGEKYDLSPISGIYSKKTSALFTPQGTKYYHMFNISVCPQDPSLKASCHRNVSMEGNAEATKTYNYTICRMTIVPRPSTTFATQPMSVGKQLMLISTRKVKENDELLSEKQMINRTIISFHYRTDGVTEACPRGRSTVIHHVCDPRRKAKSEVKLAVPQKCSEGTCDGCSFHFIMRSAAACPLCTSEHYFSVVTGCVKEKKHTTYVWKSPKICLGGKALPEGNYTKCSLLEKPIKDYAIGLGIFAGAVVLMVLAVLILWYKNRRLEYKYHKLIQNASDRSGELPGAPQCVGDDEDEDEEEVHFKSGEGRGKRFLKNIKSKFAGDSKFSDQYNFSNFSDDDIGSIEPTSKTPLS